MTAQRSKGFVNECPEFNPVNYKLFHLIGYNLKTEIEKSEKTICSALWRGYVATYTLKKNGELFLTKLSYPELFDRANIQTREKNVLEKIEGNFHLEFRENFFGKRLKIPFKNGLIVLDKSQWLYEKESSIKEILNGVPTNKT